MQYEGEDNMNNGGNQDDEEEDEGEYDNDYQEDQDDEAELETLESSFIEKHSQKYDYGTDNEEEKDEQPMRNYAPIAGAAGYSEMGSQDEVYKVKVNQSEISQEDLNNFLHKCTLTLPPQLSQKFVRLSKEFNNNIDYIMNFVYKLVG